MRIMKWAGPVVLLAAIVIGDRIRTERPAHNYRLTVEVETPARRATLRTVRPS